MSKTLTKAQLRALNSVVTHSQHGTYMPFADQMQSVNACVRKGFLEYRSVDQGFPRNGYGITDSGRLALKEADK